MKKWHLYLMSFVVIFLFVIFYHNNNESTFVVDQKSEESKENFLRHRDSIAFLGLTGLNFKKIAVTSSRLFFPVKEGVTTYFLDETETVADSSFQINFFVGYPSKDFVYILDVYLAKSQKSSLGIGMIYKKIKTNEVTTDPRSTTRWAHAVNEFKTTPLKDFVRNVCFPGWNGYIGDEYVSKKYPSTEDFATGWEKSEFVEKVTKKILAEKGNSGKEKLLNFSSKIIPSDFTDWIIRGKK